MDARHVRRARARRRALGLVAVGTAAGVLGVGSAALAGEGPPETGDNITLCHATGSKTNPYVPITVDSSAIINSNTGAVKGHGKHGDDVIPSFSVPRHVPPAQPGDPWPFAGLNVPEGQELLDNDCFTLAITKTGTPEVLPGGTINYQVAVKNVGLDPVSYSRIWVKDSKVQLTPPSNPPALLKPGASLVWTASREVPDTLRKCGRWVKNTAMVRLVEPKEDTNRSRQRRSNQYVPEGPGDSSTWMTQVICPLNVTIAKSSAQVTIEPGGTVSYGIRVTNPGPLALPTKSLSVSDPTATSLTPPAEMPDMLKPGEFLDWVATKSVAADAALCGTNVENSASVTVTPPVKPEDKVPSARKVQNGAPQSWWPYTSWPKDPVTAAATGIPVSGGICPVVTPTGTVTPAAAPVAFRPAGPALSVTKTGPARMLAGGRVGYRITVTNTGSADATNVTLRDQAPGVFTVASRPSGSTVSGRTIDWNIGTLAAGQSATRTVRFAARRTATGRACNVALATATGVDQVRARACTTIVAARRPATPVTG